MTILTLERIGTGFDLESLLELWVEPLPEHADQQRVPCIVGRNPIVVPITTRRITTAVAGFFSQRRGGNLVLMGSHETLQVMREDIIVYNVHWEEL